VADPLEILGELFSVPGTSEQYLRGRAEAIRKQGKGAIFSYIDGSTVDLNSIGSAEEFWTKLVTGGLWLDADRPARPLPSVSLLGKGDNSVDRMTVSALRPERDAASRDSRFPLTLMLFTHAAGASVGQVSPLMTKVFQESGLRSTSDTAVINPVTARSCGLDDGDLAQIETARGSRKMRISIDRSAMPGVITAAIGPDPVAFTNEGVELGQNTLSLVELDAVSAWKPTPAILRKA
jgi:hypothetical protein